MGTYTQVWIKSSQEQHTLALKTLIFVEQFCTELKIKLKYLKMVINIYANVVNICSENFCYIIIVILIHNYITRHENVKRCRILGNGYPSEKGV